MTRHGTVGAPVGERGIVLIIALIVMVALSFAGVALIRAVDTTTGVVGNLSFRQAAVAPANLAVEAAAAALFADANPGGAALISDRTQDLPAQNYYASLQPGEDARGIPTQLQKRSSYTLPRILYPAPDRYFEVRYVIERSCRAAGPATPGNCDMMAPKQGSGDTVGDGTAPKLPQHPFYRVTVRVDGPKNTTAFLQTMLR